MLVHKKDPPEDSNQPASPDAAERGRSGPSPFGDLPEKTEGLSLRQLVQVLQADQARRWTRGERVPAEAYLQAFPRLLSDAEMAGDLVYNEFLIREHLGEAPQFQEYVDRFPDLAADLERLNECVQFMHFLAFLESRAPSDSPELSGEGTGEAAEAPPPQAAEAAPAPLTIRCPHCHVEVELPADAPGEASCPHCGSPLRLRDGKFELLERIGIGSFGVVWKGRDIELDRMVALKVWHAGLVATPADAERFYREARAAAQLRHPGIVAVHEVVHLNGMPTIVADYVHGVTLSEVTAARRLTPREAARLLAEIADALEYAHNRGVVHRDLKPSNIILDLDQPLAAEDPAGEESPVAAATGSREHGPLGRPMIMDFGLVLRPEDETPMTLEGDILGTPAYMSPEQAAGRAHEADRRSDVYSAGAMLYEMLVGRPPFRGSRHRIIYQVLHDEPELPRRLEPRIPRALETICLKALAREPERRYAGAGELAADLRRFLAGEPVRARPPNLVERLGRWYRWRPVAVALAAALVLPLGAAALGLVYFQHKFAEQERQLHVATLIARIEETQTRNVPALAGQLGVYRDLAEPELDRMLHESDSAKVRLHAGLALAVLGADHGQLDDLLRELLRAPPGELVTLRSALLPHRDRFTGRLWHMLGDPQASRPERLRAACALAAFDPGDPRWTELAPAVVDALPAEDSGALGDWLEAFWPVRRTLLTPLGRLFRANDNPEGKLLAAKALADYAGDQVDVLVDLIQDADPRQHAVLWPVLLSQGDAAAALLEQAARAEAPAATPDERDRLARRRAKAAFALLKMGRARTVWPLLRHSPDARVRRHLVQAPGPLGADLGLRC
jgi:hypothetical protein